MQGKITKVNMKEGAKDGRPWKKYGIQVEGDDRWFGFFERADSITPGEGLEIEFDAKQNGKYWNAENIKIVVGSQQSAPAKNGKFDNSTMFISYAKDLYIALLTTYPQEIAPTLEDTIARVVDIGMQMKALADGYFDKAEDVPF